MNERRVGEWPADVEAAIERGEVSEESIKAALADILGMLSNRADSVESES